MQFQVVRRLGPTEPDRKVASPLGDTPPKPTTVVLYFCVDQSAFDE